VFIIADAHVSQTEEAAASFFAMLEALSCRGEDVVFLGDIFDLWIGLDRYEDALQRRFLDWCRTERDRRMIGFIEGNHEFYVVRRHRDCFTWCSDRGHRMGSLLIVHGDLINRADIQYLRWRRLSKNPVMRMLVRFWPDGPRRAEKLKAKMKKTNKAFRLGLPKKALAGYAEQRFSEGIETILVGHFHEHHTYYSGEGRQLAVLPAWHEGGQIGFFDRASQTLETGSWQALIDRCEAGR